MPDINNLLANNQKWAKQIKRDDPLFFERLEAIQKPNYL